VLMTPDDLGKAETAADLKPRARQNVVFEFGFFIGKLGPDRVTALIEGDSKSPPILTGWFTSRSIRPTDKRISA
jgi:predicted nucleotide-binding protein